LEGIYRWIDKRAQITHSFHNDIKVPAGGSVHPPTMESVENRLHYIDVLDPYDMKNRLDPVSISNFIKVIEKAVEKSGYEIGDIDFLLPLHTKKSMHRELMTRLGLEKEQSLYLDHHGHMSALDPCVGLHFAKQQNLLKKGDLAVAVSAGTGYTWTATVIEIG
jgi:3-oxoacyl-[acyl-carrier-protein] synthase-3